MHLDHKTHEETPARGLLIGRGAGRFFPIAEPKVDFLSGKHDVFCVMYAEHVFALGFLFFCFLSAKWIPRNLPNPNMDPR